MLTLRLARSPARLPAQVLPLKPIAPLLRASDVANVHFSPRNALLLSRGRCHVEIFVLNHGRRLRVLNANVTLLLVLCAATTAAASLAFGLTRDSSQADGRADGRARLQSVSHSVSQSDNRPTVQASDRRNFQPEQSDRRGEALFSEITHSEGEHLRASTVSSMNRHSRAEHVNAVISLETHRASRTRSTFPSAFPIDSRKQGRGNSFSNTKLCR